MKCLFLEYFSFAMFGCYDYYEMICSFQENVITFSWQIFVYFYQISDKCYCLIFLIDLFTWTTISSTSQKYKARGYLEVPKKSLFKPTLNEQNNFSILVRQVTMETLDKLPMLALPWKLLSLFRIFLFLKF